jgi:hypothetical protein
MRKILISILLLFGTIGLFAQQNTFKYVVRANGGLQVGGSTLVKIDSITSSAGNIYFWSGGAILSAVPGGGSATWGAISGSLASQIDLTNALNLKANLVSPTFTGTPTVPGYVPTSRTVNSKALTSNISLTASDVGALGASDTASMLSKYARKYSPVFTGTPTVPGYVPTSRSVNGHTLTGNIAVTAADVGLGNVTNESKATMFTSPVFTGIVKLDPTDTLATRAYARSVGGGTGSMIYPGAGIALSTGSAWASSITNNSTNWNTAYSWVNTNGANAVTAYGWGNHASAGYVPNTRTVNSHALTGNISVTASDVGLGNVTNESKATMFTNPTFTGTVGGISSSMVGLGNVTNESKSTMFSSPTFTGTVTIPTPFTLGGVSVTPTGAELNFVDGVTSAIQGQLNLKAPLANATLTGTTNVAKLQVGNASSDTKTELDSISYTGGKLAFWDGADTLSLHINTVDQVDISTIAVMVSPNSYYVKTGGDDSNTGLSDAQAWAHHPWMSTWTGTVTLKPGDIVYMNKGDTWTIANPVAAYMTVGQSGASGNYITTTAYGTGAKPIINISTNSAYPVISADSKNYIKIDNLEITHYDEATGAGTQNGIKVTHSGTDPPHDWVITNCTIHNIPYNGIYFAANAYNVTIGDATATTTATTTSYSNLIYDCGYAGIILQGGDATTNRSDFTINYNYIHDINMAGAWGQDAYGVAISAYTTSYVWPAYVNVNYNYIANVPIGKGIDSHGGNYQYFNHNYIYNCRILVNPQLAVRVDYPTGLLSNIYCDYNILEQPGNHPTNYYLFFSESTEDTLLRPVNLNIRHNSIFYTARPAAESLSRGIYISDVDGATIEGNHIYNGPQVECEGGIVLCRTLGQKAKDVIIRNNFITDWDFGIRCSAHHIDGDVKIYNNIVYSPKICIQLYNVTVVSGDTLGIYNNSLVSVGMANARNIGFITGVKVNAGGALKIKNNIMAFENAGAYYYVDGPTSHTGTFEMDYNLYYNSTLTPPFYMAGQITLAGLKAAGYETNSPNYSPSLNPNFTNSSGTYLNIEDYILKSNSPAIDVGKSLNLLTDYNGGARIGNYDIGAIEKLYSTDVDNQYKETTLSVYQNFGTTIKSFPIIPHAAYMGSGSAQTDGRCWFSLHYISKTTTLTGVALEVSVNGDYTNDNFNGIGLYKVCATKDTITLVATSADNGTFLESGANTSVSVAFTSTYVAGPGYYYAAMLYNESAHNTVPTVWTITNAALLVNSTMITGGNMILGYRASLTAFPATLYISTQLTPVLNCPYLLLY